MTKNKKGKTLQNFTDFDKINSVKELKEYLLNNPDQREELKSSLYGRLNDSYTKKLRKEELITGMLEVCENTQGKDVVLRNVTYEYNHSLISGIIHNLVLKNRGFPTTQKIADETGLSRQTVYNHLKGSFNKYNSLLKGKTEYMVHQALTNLYLIGIEERSASALKAFIELTGATTRATHNTVNNYIQINNLKLSKEDFYQLPTETLTEIEVLISRQLGQ